MIFTANKRYQFQKENKENKVKNKDETIVKFPAKTTNAVIFAKLLLYEEAFDAQRIL